MVSVLTLCVGNICRSPLAEALLKRDLPGASVWSAGLSALIGEPADPYSVYVAEQAGLDIKAHRAQQVNAILCQQATVILVMEQSQKLQLEAMYPLVRGKTYRIGQFADMDIDDPYQKSENDFRQTFVNIEKCLAHWIPRIKKLV